FKGEAKGRAIGTWAAAGAIASAAGPPLGGWLVDAVGWRAVFALNVPVAAAAMLITWRFVAENRPDTQALDWAGGALATLALGALTWALTLWSGGQGLTTAVWVGLIVGMLVLGAFLLVEHRRGDRAM